ncbi:MAG: lytic murein transglycosylase B [Spongiibacteraceae bacterium]
MFKKLRAVVMLSVGVLFLPQPALAEENYSDHAQAKAFVEKMVSEHNFDRGYVQQLMAEATRKQTILDAIARPAEKTKTWAEYRKIFVNELRISQGREFMQQYAEPLARAERDFGVPANIISAIIGVETRYGRHKGNYRVIDALTTLGFDYPPRSKFFSSELEQYLLLTREQGFNAAELKGSYAGAMGYGQFISSSYRHYAIDYDGDGIADIVNNPVDAIGSVANYFKSHGWLPGEVITVKARVSKGFDAKVANQNLKPTLTVAALQDKGYQPVTPVAAEQVATAMILEGESGEEYWLGLQNFYVITRYNHSALYAMAVYQFSEQLVAN